MTHGRRAVPIVLFAVAGAAALAALLVLLAPRDKPREVVARPRGAPSRDGGAAHVDAATTPRDAGAAPQTAARPGIAHRGPPATPGGAPPGAHLLEARRPGDDRLLLELVDRSEALAKRERYRQALTYCKKALLIDETDARALTVCSICACALKMASQARTYLDRVQRYHPHPARDEQLRRICLHLGVDVE